MAIQGKLEEASLPDVLQLLSLGKKSGCLSLTDQTLQGQIYLDGGRITHATVANRRDRLGDMLVRGGRITQEQLAQAVERQTADQTKNLGQILVESGQIPRAELERFSHVQIEEAVYFLFTWRKGTFTFESGLKPPVADFLVSINPEGLLLEGARRVDEWSLIEKKIPSFDMIFKLDKARLAGSDVTLTPEQRRLLPLLDGQHDVNAVVEASAMPEFDVGKALYGLASAGFAALIERRASIRHLDYRELLAYLVHEAEFADPERRKEATRHIVDCQLCAPRLKEIHVRRTRETGAIQVPVTAAGPGSTGAQAASPPSAPLRPAAALAPQRRSGDRRTARPREAAVASDRRHGQRRRGDRRAAVAALPRGAPERRAGERRHAERRLKDRLSLAIARAASAGPAPSGGTRPKRNTGPRRLPPVSDRSAPAASSRPPVSPRAPAQPAPAAPPAPAAAPPPPLAATVAESPAAPTAAQPPGKTTQASATPVSAEPRTRARTKEIEWLVTPEESGVHPVVKAPPLPPLPPRQPAQTQPVVAPSGGSQKGGATTTVAVPQVRGAAPVAPAPVNATPVAGMPVTTSPMATPPVATPTTGPNIQPVPAQPGLPARQWLAIAAAAVVFTGISSAVAVTLMLRPAVSDGTDSRAAPASGLESASPPTLGPPQAATVATTEPEPAPQRTPTPARLPAARTTVPPPDAVPARPQRATARPAEGTPGETRAAAPTPTRPVPAQETRVAEPPPLVERPAPTPAPAATPPAAVAQPVAAAAAPEKAGLTGAVRDARTGAPISGVRLRIAGTALSTATDPDGKYEFPEPPAGPTLLVAAVAGYAPQSGDVVMEAGVAATLDLVMQPPPTASQPDEELVAARWERIEAAEAEKLLGQPVAVIPGLWIESVAKTPAATRARVRVAQITPSGERVALVETRSAATARADRPRLTALRVMPPSEAYPVTTGTGSFGNLLVTATSALAPDALRTLLGRLIEAPR